MLPILRNIQSDLADVKRTVEQVKIKVDSVEERMDSFEDYFTYPMGLTARNQMDVKKLQSDVRALRDRVEEFEPQS